MNQAESDMQVLHTYTTLYVSIDHQKHVAYNCSMKSLLMT